MKPLMLEGRGGGGGVRAHEQQAQFRNSIVNVFM